jgi:hypothetical protein
MLDKPPIEVGPEADALKEAFLTAEAGPPAGAPPTSPKTSIQRSPESGGLGTRIWRAISPSALASRFWRRAESATESEQEANARPSIRAEVLAVMAGIGDSPKGPPGGTED